jgi:hypothetical protein
VGLVLEFATGSHAFRSTGSPLENHAWWIRLNQFWAALVPALGSECCVQARRAEPLVSTPQSLPKGHGRHRALWIGGILAIVTALAFAIRFLLTR